MILWLPKLHKLLKISEASPKIDFRKISIPLIPLEQLRETSIRKAFREKVWWAMQDLKLRLLVALPLARLVFDRS